MKFTHIDIVFENCDVATIPAKQIIFFDLNGIKEDYGMMNYRSYGDNFADFYNEIMEYKKAEQGYIIFSADLEKEHIETAFSHKDKMVLAYDRLQDWNDITSIDVYKGKKLLKRIYIDYLDDAANDYQFGANNLLQKTFINKFNELQIEFMRREDALNINFQLLNGTAQMPTKAHETDAGFDIYADQDVTIWPHQNTVVTTGIASEIPKGYYCAVHPRSGMRFKEGISFNGEGIIDSEYRGEWKIVMLKTKEGEPYQIKAGDRIAQFVVHRVPNVSLHKKFTLDDTVRGVGGMGSTGI